MKRGPKIEKVFKKTIRLISITVFKLQIFKYIVIYARGTPVSIRLFSGALLLKLAHCKASRYS